MNLRDNSRILQDSWEISGSKDKEKMYSVLEYLSEITKVKECRTDHIELFTFKEASKNTLMAYHHTNRGTMNYGESIQKLQEKSGLTMELLNETVKSSRLMFQVYGELYTTSIRILKTLCQRAGSAMGDFALREEIGIRFHRDAGYMAYMKAQPSFCKVLYRQVGNTRKALAVFSERYKQIPQYPIIKSLIEGFDNELGTSALVQYTINNFWTDIYLEFPDKAQEFKNVYNLKNDVVPGIRILLSDTGDSSFIIYGTMRIGRTVVYIPGAEYARCHTKKANLEEIIKNVEQRIFVEYTKMPDRLIELLQVDISSPTPLILKLVEYCQVKKEMGAEICTELMDTLTNSINPSVQYTAYDIVMLFLDICTDMESKDKFTKTKCSRELLTKARKCFSKVLFYKFENEA